MAFLFFLQAFLFNRLQKPKRCVKINTKNPSKSLFFADCVCFCGPVGLVD